MSDEDGSGRGDDEGTGPRDTSRPEDAANDVSANKAIRQASLRERLQAQLVLLRDQVRRLNQALAKSEDPNFTSLLPPSQEPAGADGATTDDGLPSAGVEPPPARGPHEIDGQATRNRVVDLVSLPPSAATRSPAPPRKTANAKIAPTPLPDGTPPVAAPAVSGRQGALVLLEITETDIRAMIHAGLLGRADIANPARIGAAVQMIVARWRATVPVPPQIAGETLERRSGRERRRGSPRSSSLLSYVTGTEFDRRKKGERRRRKDDSADAEQAPPPNLLTLDDARAKRLRQQRRRGSSLIAETAAAPIPIATASPIRRSASDCIDGVEGERKPDETESPPLVAPDRLFEKEDRQQKVRRRRDVLDQTEGGEGNAPGGGDEQEER